MNKTVKILAILVLAVMMVMTVSSTVMATSYANVIGSINDKGGVANDDKINNAAGIILGYIRNIAVVIGIIALTIIGVKYMLGSVEEKAEYKKTLIPLVVGIIIVIAATTIVSMLFSINF